MLINIIPTDEYFYIIFLTGDMSYSVLFLHPSELIRSNKFFLGRSKNKINKIFSFPFVRLSSNSRNSRYKHTKVSDDFSSLSWTNPHHAFQIAQTCTSSFLIVFFVCGAIQSASWWPCASLMCLQCPLKIESVSTPLTREFFLHIPLLSHKANMHSPMTTFHPKERMA